MYKLSLWHVCPLSTVPAPVSVGLGSQTFQEHAMSDRGKLFLFQKYTQHALIRRTQYPPQGPNCNIHLSKILSDWIKFELKTKPFFRTTVWSPLALPWLCTYVNKSTFKCLGTYEDHVRTQKFFDQKTEKNISFSEKIITRPQKISVKHNVRKILF